MRHNLDRNSSGSVPSVISSLNTHRCSASTSLNGLIELLARDIREYGPVAERKNGSAHEAMTGWKQQLPVPFQRAHDVESIFASLLQGIGLPHDAAARHQFDFCFVGRRDYIPGASPSPQARVGRSLDERQ